MEYEAIISNIIASLPEVLGGFLYHPQKGIYSKQTAALASDDSLQEVGLKLTKIVSMISVHFQDTGDIRVCFKDLILYGTRIDEGGWLFLLHHPSLSPGMLKMTVQMALNMGPDPSLPPNLPDNTLQEHNTPSQPQDSPRNTSIDALLGPHSPLKKTLDDIQGQLAQHIGPIAGLVFQDSLEIWAAQAPPSLDGLPGLVSLIEEEIEDEGERQIFRDSLNIQGER